jgi:hypothetical protein
MLTQAPAAQTPGQPRQLPIFTIDGQQFPRAVNGEGTMDR